MAIYRGPGGPGDATADASNAAALADSFADAANASAGQSAASAASALAAKVAAELAETNAETAETNAEAVLTNAGFVAVSSNLQGANTIGTVATNIANVNNTGNNIANVNTVAGVSANITTVAGISSNVTTVATNNTNVSTVASNIAAVNTNATNIVAIQNASTNATNAANSATAASTSASTATTQATNASNSASAASASQAAALASQVAAEAAFDAFDDIYLGAKASNPTVDNDGGTLTTGDQYFNTVANELRVWNGSSWQTASVVGGTVTNLSVTGNTTIVSGTIDGTTVGASTASTGRFSTLEATGVSTFSAGTVSAPAITTTGDTNTGIFFPAADTIAFTEGGVESMRIDSSGNVGIGNAVASTINTENNAGNLVVGAGNTSDGITIYSGTTSIGSLNFADGTTTTSTYAGYMAYFHATDAMTFGTGAAERMRINSSGDVGIGTTSLSGLTGGGGSLIAAGVLGASNVLADHQTNRGILQYGSNITSIRSYGATSGTGQIVFSTGGGGGSADAERMRIDSSGNVGIGTSSPVYQTQIYGSGQTTAALTDAGNKGGSLLLNTPATAGGDGGALLIGASGSGAKSFAAIKGLLTDSANNTLGDLAFSTRNALTDTALTERMRIAANGNVGIGTSSPSERLTVAGAIRTTITPSNSVSAAVLIANSATTSAANLQLNTDGGLAFWNFQSGGAGWINPVTISTSGNVGIGTSSPAVRLDVNRGSEGEYLRAGGDDTGNNGRGLRFTSSTGGGFIGAMHTLNAPSSGGTIAFATNSTERMRIDSSGNLLVGATSSGLGTTRFYVGNDGTNITTLFAAGGSTSASVEISRYYHGAATGATNATMLQFLASNGAGVGSIVSNGTATLYQTTSDYRLKTVIAPVSDSGTRLDALQPIEYDWNAGGRTRGFLAHQFAEVYPSSVSGEKDAVDVDGKPKYQSMQASSTEVMADLIAEIQSLRKRVAQLESK